MKQFSFSLLLLFASGYACFAQVSWSAPVTVTSGAAFGNLHPRISLNRNGDPMVLWGKTNESAYCARWSGVSFTAPIELNPSSTMPVFALDWAGPDLASFGDTVYAVMKHTPESVLTNYIYLTHSYDGGATFSTPVRVDNIDTNASLFPSVTTDTTGNPVITFMKGNSTFMDPHYVTTRSADYGLTFTPDVLATGTAGEVCDCCPATVISSGGNTIVLYRNNLSNIRDIWAAISSDGGMTYPGNINVDNNNWMVMSCPSSGPDGFVIGDSIYSVFRSNASGAARVYFSRASISGLTSSVTPITGAITGLLSQDYPRIANAGNEAVAVWKQNVTGSGNYIAYSFTMGIHGGFSASAIVASAFGSSVRNADVAMSPGNIHVVWEDDNGATVKYIRGTYTIPISGISQPATKRRLELYPNPANGYFSLDLDKTGQINNCYLTDKIGRRHDLQPVIKNNRATFPVSGIAKGVYFFVANDEAGNTCYSKIAVE